MHIKASRRRDEDEEKESKGAAQWVSLHSGGNLSKSTERRLRRQHLSFIRKFESLRVARNLRPQSKGFQIGFGWVLVGHPAN